MILSHSIFPTGLPLKSILWKLYPLYFIYLSGPQAHLLHLPSCHLWTHDHKAPQPHHTLVLFSVLMLKININNCKCAQGQPAHSAGRNHKSNVSMSPHPIHQPRRAALHLADAYTSAATSRTAPLHHIQSVLPTDGHVLSAHLHTPGTVWAAAVSQQGF